MKAQYRAMIIDTILKELRSKTLIFIFVATTASIILAQLILSAVTGQMGGDANLAVAGVDVLSINFAILNSISFIIATVFGVSVLRSDFENNIIYQYLTFPISRIEYFGTRVIGTWLLVVGYYVYAFVLSSVLFSYTFKKMVVTPAHFASLLVLAVYLLIVIFIAIFFSLFVNKIGALFSTFVAAGFAMASYREFSTLAFKEQFMNMSGFKALGAIFYYLFPRLSFLDSASSSLLSKNPMTVNITEQVIHLVLISGVYVYLVNYFIKKKDF